jgi:hypothetical protein
MSRKLLWWGAICLAWLPIFWTVLLMFGVRPF